MKATILSVERDGGVEVGLVLRLPEGMEVKEGDLLMARPPTKEESARGQFEKEQSEVLSQLPEQFRDFVSGFAWEEGHSAGYHEVLMYLNELTESLVPAVSAYKDSLKK